MINKGLGYFQSPRDDRDVIFGSSIAEKAELPKEYMLKGNHSVVDQGEDPICAAICISHIIYWQTSAAGKRRMLNPHDIFDLRYDKNMQGMIPRDALRSMQKVGVNDYHIGHYARVTNAEEAKSAILANGPLMICVNAYDKEDFWRPGGYYLGGHAVLLTGWNEEGFRLQNSWGTSWANKGRTIFPESDWVNVLESWTIMIE